MYCFLSQCCVHAIQKSTKGRKLGDNCVCSCADDLQATNKWQPQPKPEPESWKPPKWNYNQGQNYIPKPSKPSRPGGGIYNVPKDQRPLRNPNKLNNPQKYKPASGGKPPRNKKQKPPKNNVSIKFVPKLHYKSLSHASNACLYYTYLLLQKRQKKKKKVKQKIQKKENKKPDCKGNSKNWSQAKQKACSAEKNGGKKKRGIFT